MTDHKFARPVVVRRSAPVCRALERYSGTKIPVRSGDVFSGDGKTKCFVKSLGYTNSAAVPVFMCCSEFRHTWDGATRGTFLLTIQDAEGQTRQFTPTDLVGIDYRHVSQPRDPKIHHPYVLLTYEGRFLERKERFRMWRDQAALLRAVDTWKREPFYGYKP